MIEYDSARRPPPFVDEFVQLLRYRDLVLLMAGNILKNRYKLERQVDEIPRLPSDSQPRQQWIARVLETTAQFHRRREARDTLAWIENILAAGTAA